ncbi:MAG: YlbF family regulator [Bacillota bacterium]
MNVYDSAHNLARSLKNSQEYEKYQAALSKIKGDQEKESILTSLRKKQMEIQGLQMMGREVSADKMQELEKASQILNFHPVIKDFLEAEYQLGRMIADVQKIIGETFDLWYPDINNK